MSYFLLRKILQLQLDYNATKNLMKMFIEQDFQNAYNALFLPQFFNLMCINIERSFFCAKANKYYETLLVLFISIK